MLSTTNAAVGSGDANLQVRQVEAALRAIYVNGGLLETGDLEGKPAEYRDPRLLSRALAAQGVRIVTGFSPKEAALTIIDGVADQGIDAIAVVEGADPHVYLVQAKWSKNGAASSDRSAVMELLAGLRLIDDEDFAPFNPRGQQLAGHAKTIMAQGPVPVTQVIVLMRAGDVTDGFRNALANGEKEFNRHGDVLGHRIILASEVWGSIRRPTLPSPAVGDDAAAGTSAGGDPDGIVSRAAGPGHGVVAREGQGPVLSYVVRGPAGCVRDPVGERTHGPVGVGASCRRRLSCQLAAGHVPHVCRRARRARRSALHPARRGTRSRRTGRPGRSAPHTPTTAPAADPPPPRWATSHRGYPLLATARWRRGCCIPALAAAIPGFSSAPTLRSCQFHPPIRSYAGPGPMSLR